MRLIAVLRPEADEHDLALAVANRHRRGLLRDHFFPEQPPALQQVALDVGRYDLDVLAVQRGGHFVGLTPGHEERHAFGRHAIGDRMRGVVAHAQRRARSPELLRGQVRDDVAQRQAEALDGQVARLREGHERATLLHEPLQGLDAVGAEAAAILGRRAVLAPAGAASSAAASATTAARRLAGHRRHRIGGQDDHIEPGVEITLPDFRVHERRERDVELLEHQSRPALVHVAAAVALIHRDPRLANVVGGGRNSARGRSERHPGLLGDFCHRGRRAAGDDEVAGRESLNARHPPHGDALLEQEIDGAEAVVQLAC